MIFEYLYMMDPTYLLVLIGVLIAMWASINVNTTIKKYSKVTSDYGLTGAQVAENILRNAGISDVTIVKIAGNMTDHYNPSTKQLGLSDTTYDKNSIAAVSVAAHECGHAIQHAEGYMPLSIRSALVPLANIGSHAAWLFIIIGLMFASDSSQIWLNIGIICFSLAVLFQLVTLPVEFNASSRALKCLSSYGLIHDDENKKAKKVLFAAALTYVAAALAAILQLLRIIALFGGRRRD